MTHHEDKRRPAPIFKNGVFSPSVPVPDTKTTDEYRWYHAISAIRTIARNPLESFNAEQYQNPVTQYNLFGTAYSVINDPKLIKHCFVDNRSNYKFSDIRQRVLRAVIGDGLISAEGKKWTHARRAMSPMFTPRNVKKFAAVMKETTEREMPNVLETGEIIEISNPMAALTYLVLSDTLFSGEIQREQKSVLKDVATALTYVGRPDPLDLLKAPEWVPRLTRLRGLKAVKHLRDMISELAEDRKQRKDAGQDLPDDFLSRLLLVGDSNTAPFKDEDVIDHLLAFIGAGHETTARALSWLFYLLSNDPTSLGRLEAEVDALDIDNIPPEQWGEHLPFTLACFEETMRLFPPAPFIVREAIHEDTKDDITIPAKSVLFLNTWQLHRHETLWENPGAFIPERFLGAARDKIGRFQYLPFGVGERVCIGQRFALQEAAILIALLTRRYRFAYAGEDVPWPKLRITIQPENDMPMRVKQREKPH
ncbi:cytochrome P450 [Hellea balneolensis]|uniref:cytochrome P450 n=1 Tax=Hellea balneolensis TaxID=287478 RepID=UPI000406C459|nr:cytochrome P450 [Hellea balneolensis]